MGLLEDVAVADLKFSLFLAPTTVAFGFGFFAGAKLFGDPNVAAGVALGLVLAAATGYKVLGLLL